MDGRYTLEVQATAAEPWSKAQTLSLPIQIAPPWYASVPAYCFYVLTLLVLIGAGFRYQRDRLAIQFTADLNRREIERLKSIDAFKNRFFAYIAHEFKTPTPRRLPLTKCSSPNLLRPARGRRNC